MHDRPGHLWPTRIIADAAQQEREMTVDWMLNAEQIEFRDTLRDWVNRELPKHDSREAERIDGNYPHHLFDRLAQAGYHATSVPVEYGGRGADLVTPLITQPPLTRLAVVCSAPSTSVPPPGSVNPIVTFSPPCAICGSKVRFCHSEP